MAKVDLRPEQIELLLQMDEEGKAYLEYNEKVGGEPIGLFIPFGYPSGVEETGGVVAVYRECIKQGVTWEDLLNFNPPDDAIL
jgi:hypothetical protein